MKFVDEQAAETPEAWAVYVFSFSSFFPSTSRQLILLLLLAARLDTNLHDLVDVLAPKPKHHKLRLATLRCFEEIVQRLWPGSKVELFGSTATGIYLPDGDLDVVVSHPTLFRTDTTHLSALRDVLLSTSFAEQAYANHRARVPILTFTTSAEFGSFRFDVSLNREDGVKDVEACRRMLEELEEKQTGLAERAQELVLLLKLLLRQKNLASASTNGVGGLATFCLGLRPPQDSLVDDFLALLRHYSDGVDYAHSSVSPASGSLVERNSDREELTVIHPVNSDTVMSMTLKRTNILRKLFRHTVKTLSDAADLPSSSNFDSRIAVALEAAHLCPTLAIFEALKVQEGCLAEALSTALDQVNSHSNLKIGTSALAAALAKAKLRPSSDNYESKDQGDLLLISGELVKAEREWMPDFHAIKGGQKKAK
ncbi:hypothetical protein JCM8547_002877 [Rhodosporidiobolus lusitaniae]